MNDLAMLLDTADTAIARSEGALPSDRRRELAQTVRKTRHKLGYIGDVLVVAFAGPTGSGKSTLINAVLGASIAETGVIRPTTDAALAVIPPGTGNRYRGLLSRMNITERVESSALASTILVDLPDFDSVEASHRFIVEEVLPVVDAVVWVFDPEKYADRVAHDEFLAHLAPYQDQFLFVLNQADRLGGDIGAVVQDLALLLEADGFVEPEVVSTVGVAPDLDVARLLRANARRLDTKRTLISKVATDLRVAANDGWTALVSETVGVEDTAERDKIELAAATFVSLGVEAIEVLAQLQREEAT